MKVVYHLGVHCTDELRLQACLRRSSAALSTQGIVIPDPDVYRPILRNVVNAMKGAPSSAETEELVLDAVMVEDEAERIVFSNEAFLCVRPRVLAKGVLYAGAAEKIAALAKLLPGHEAEMALAIRNPATFLPALFQSSKVASFEEFIAGTDPLQLSWAEMLGRVRETVPEVPITVWCDEDTPLLWPDVLRAVAGCSAEIALEGEEEIVASLMTAEGARRMAAYLEARPGLVGEPRRKVVAAFLDKYAEAEKIEVELDVPGWDTAYVEALSERYDSDVAAISALPGVRFIGL